MPMQDCFVCKDRDNLFRMLLIKWNKTDQDGYYICYKCHRGFYKFGYTDTGIYTECLKLEVKKTYDLENKDKVRQNKSPITCEEIAEFAWQIRYNKKWWENI